MILITRHNVKLPDGFQLYENEDTVTLVCCYCGTEALYVAGAVLPSSIEGDATAHRAKCACPKDHLPYALP